MTDSVRISFEQKVKTLPLSSILPLRTVDAHIKKSVKYKRIAASIAEVGIIEPLVVTPTKNGDGKYLLLDGNMRYAALSDAGKKEVNCIAADDDEAFTYNKRINRLATVQEHLMIVNALKRGVSEEKLAKSLNVDITQIKRRRVLLDGICPEVVELLKDRIVTPSVFGILRKMKPMRQIEAAELMATVANFTLSYAKALLAATKQTELKSDRPKKIAGVTPEQMARMEREMASLQQDYKVVEASYGDDMLHLVIASGYLSRLIRNPEIERYLARNHPEILNEFRATVAATSMTQI